MRRGLSWIDVGPPRPIVSMDANKLTRPVAGSAENGSPAEVGSVYSNMSESGSDPGPLKNGVQ